MPLLGFKGQYLPPGLCVFFLQSHSIVFLVALQDQRVFWTVAPSFRAPRTVARASSKDKFY